MTSTLTTQQSTRVFLRLRFAYVIQRQASGRWHGRRDYGRKFGKALLVCAASENEARLALRTYDRLSDAARQELHSQTPNVCQCASS